MHWGTKRFLSLALLQYSLYCWGLEPKPQYLWGLSVHIYTYIGICTHTCICKTHTCIILHILKIYTKIQILKDQINIRRGFSLFLSLLSGLSLKTLALCNIPTPPGRVATKVLPTPRPEWVDLGPDPRTIPLKTALRDHTIQPLHWADKETRKLRDFFPKDLISKRT